MPFIDEFREGLFAKRYGLGMSTHARLGYLFARENRRLRTDYQCAFSAVARWNMGDVSAEQLEASERRYVQLFSRLAGLEALTHAYPEIQGIVLPVLSSRSEELRYLENLINSRLGRNIYGQGIPSSKRYQGE